MKKTMKLLSLALVLALLVSCVAIAPARAEGKIRVVTTIFPIYDWTREVAGEDGKAEVTLLLDKGVDLHSYQPTVADIMRIATCDVFIYVGGESEEWVEDVLKEAVNPDMKVVNLLEAMGEEIKMEEIVEGMERDDDHDHDEAGDEHDGRDHDHGEEADEHVWLSLRNARKLTLVIADALGEADPDGAQAYRANAEAYGEKLAALDGEYEKAVEAGDYDTLLFGDRFPFRYLVDDYGLKYYAAFSGCSAETEASFETIVFLAGKVGELGLPCVLTIDGGDRRIAETVVSSTKTRDQVVLSLNSMQGATGQDVEAGETYLGIMEKNLEALKQALSKK